MTFVVRNVDVGSAWTWWLWPVTLRWPSLFTFGGTCILAPYLHLHYLCTVRFSLLEGCSTSISWGSFTRNPFLGNISDCLSNSKSGDPSHPHSQKRTQMFQHCWQWMHIQRHCKQPIGSSPHRGYFPLRLWGWSCNCILFRHYFMKPLTNFPSVEAQ